VAEPQAWAPPQYPERPDLFAPPRRGSPSPLGATLTRGGVNFAVVSSVAEACSLCLFTASDLKRGLPTVEVPLRPDLHYSGGTWHIELPALSPELTYGWRVSGPPGSRCDPSKILLDPYARSVVGQEQFGVPGRNGECWPQVAGSIPKAGDEFDWQGDRHPNTPMAESVIYELHVRGFTAHPSSRVVAPGTYQGLIQKLPYLKSLGVTAVELLPVHEFNELEYFGPNPAAPGEMRYNFWGYSTVNFFSPMLRYAAAGGADHGRAAIREFKEMVRACHREGIEVILDVVFNHTAEGNDKGPTLSFRGLDDRAYYMVAPEGQYYNYSGCGNTVNCNHPVARKMILDSLRYWVTEMHVDGFRFDLAAILTRSSDLYEEPRVFGNAFGNVEGKALGDPIGAPPVVDMIANDPVLRSVKLIAEPWDCGGQYLVGSFPSWGVWAEWNGRFRDAARNFVKGTEGAAGDFAQCLVGCPELYAPGGRSPYHGVNFVTAHDGFSLADVVSYNEKANEANGEGGEDGEEHNASWNCGVEGPSADPAVVRTRARQVRNLALALLASQGVPMVLMGDEYAHSKGGNNNTYCHDSALNWFNWHQAEEDAAGLGRFFRELIAFRRRQASLRQGHFLQDGQVEWYGVDAQQGGGPDWESGKFLGMFLRGPASWEGGDVYIAFNAGHEHAAATLPPAYDGCQWVEVVNTGRPAPLDLPAADLPEEVAGAAAMAASTALAEHLLPLLPYSAAVLETKFIGWD